MTNPKDTPAQPAPASSKYPERENLFQFLLSLKANHRYVVSEIFRDEEASKYPEPLSDDYDESISDRFGR